jgi:hypothetical protein
MSVLTGAPARPATTYRTDLVTALMTSARPTAPR